MRVSTSQIYNSSLNQMQNSQAKLAEIQEKISSGKAILRPSDDPIAAARILKLERELSRTEVFDANIDASTRRLELEEITLEQIDDATTRVRELTLQASNGTNSEADRNIIAEEIRQLQSSIFSLMNTKDSEGEYLFAGNQGKTQPFVKNGDGSYSYVADDGQRYIQAGPELQIATTDSGRDAFMVLENQLEVSVLGPDASLISAPEFTDEEGEEFKAFSEEHGDLLVQIRNAPGSLPGEYEYIVTDSSGASLASEVTADGDTLTVGGISFDLNALSTSSIEVIQRPAGISDTRAVSAEQVLDNTAYLAFVESEGSDLNVAVTLGTNAGELEYGYAITTADGSPLEAPYTITPPGPITEPTQVTISDGVTDFLTFTLTPPTNEEDPTLNLISDDSELSVGVTNLANDASTYITNASVSDPQGTDYSAYMGANGDVDVVFQNNGGVIEYDVLDGTGTSIIGGFSALPVDGAISLTDVGIDFEVDVAALTLALPNDTDTTVGGGEITLSAQVSTVLSGEAQVNIRAVEGRHSLLGTMNALIEALELPAEEFDSTEFGESIATALDELTEAKEANLGIRTSIGARINSLESAADVNADYKLFTESALSLLQDLDYATAISEFTLQETALQASQATFSRVSSLSLFNYL